VWVMRLCGRRSRFNPEYSGLRKSVSFPLVEPFIIFAMLLSAPGADRSIVAHGLAERNGLSRGVKL
jgi:hypothetical protein